MTRDWNEVIWTDEAKLELGERLGHRRVMRLPGEEFLPKNIQLTFKSSCKSIMVWGCIAHGVKGPLIKLEFPPATMSEKGRRRGGGLGAKEYVAQVLEGPLKDFFDRIEQQQICLMLVVEDGAPAHTSRLAKSARLKLGITPLTHPLSSPDLNPIEPLWLLLKNRVADTPDASNSLENLWLAAQHAWEEITEEEIQRHTGKMPERVAQVQAAKGWHTRF